MTVATHTEGDQACVARRLEELTGLNRDLEVRTPKAYGVNEGKWSASLETMANQALASGSPAYSPRVPNTQEMIEFYSPVWA